jgi:hypothetical protein
MNSERNRIVGLLFLTFLVLAVFVPLGVSQELPTLPLPLCRTFIVAGFVQLTICLKHYTFSSDYKTVSLQGTVRVDRSPFTVRILSVNAWVSTNTQNALGTGSLDGLPVTVPPSTDVDVSAVLQSYYSPTDLERIGSQSEYIRIQASAMYCVPISLFGWSACNPWSWNYDESYTPAQISQIIEQQLAQS